MHPLVSLVLLVKLLPLFASSQQTASDLSYYYMSTEKGYLHIDGDGWLTVVSDKQQATTFLEEIYNGNTYTKIASGSWDERYVTGTRNGIGAYKWSRCGSVKLIGNTLYSQSDDTAGGRLLYRKSNKFCYFYTDTVARSWWDYEPLTVRKVRVYYLIQVDSSFATFDSDGWLTTTSEKADATLFRDVEYGGNMYVKVASGYYRGCYLGARRTKLVGAYMSGDKMNWIEYLLQAETGHAAGHHLVFRRSNSYFYLYDDGSPSEYVAVNGRKDLGSLVSLYELLRLRHPYVGSVTSQNALELLHSAPKSEDYYETKPVKVYRATNIPWDKGAIELNHILKSKYQNKPKLETADVGPLVSAAMVEDPNNMVVLGLRLLALSKSYAPMSQFVSVGCTYQISSAFDGRLYSFDVVPSGPKLASGGECQYQIFGGTRINNLVIERMKRK